jgi:hypothetical protein
MSETVSESPEVAATEPVDDLRSALGDAWDAQETPPTEAPARGEDGKFTSAAEPEAEVEAEPAAPEPIPAPATLTPDIATKWDTLPRDAQEIIAQREAEAAKVAAEVRDVGPVRDVLARHEPLYAARGIPAAQALEGLFSAQRMLETRPVEAIAALARQYGVDLASFANQQVQQYNPADPLAAMQAKLTALESTLTQQQEQAARAAEAEIQQTVAAFASNPDYPHFPAVRTLMGSLMQSGVASNMADAYAMACRAHPDIHAKITATEKANAERQQAAERAKAAAAAKARAVSPRAAPTVNGFATIPDSLRGAIEAAYPHS